MAGAWAMQGFAMFSIIEKSSGRWIGRLGPWVPEGWPGTEVGWGLLRDAWGKGYATEGATAAIDWAFAHLGWSEVIHTIGPENVASQAVASETRLAQSAHGATAGAVRARARRCLGSVARGMVRATRGGQRMTTTVYGMKTSGNCYKVQLLLEQIGRPYRWVEIDSTSGETRTPEYLAKNPNGKVPLLELDDGRRLAESNAILCYLAEGTPLLPTDAWQRARDAAMAVLRAVQPRAVRRRRAFHLPVAGGRSSAPGRACRACASAATRRST